MPAPNKLIVASALVGAIFALSQAAHEDINLASVSNPVTSPVYEGTANTHLATLMFTRSDVGGKWELWTVTITANDAGGVISERDNLSGIRAYYDTDNTPSVADNTYGASTLFSSNTNGHCTCTFSVMLAGVSKNTGTCSSR
jgi:hypothetical protein